MRLNASQIEQRYGSPFLLPSRPEPLVLLAARGLSLMATADSMRRGRLWRAGSPRQV